MTGTISELEQEVIEARSEAYMEAARKGMRTIDTILAQIGGRLLDPACSRDSAIVDYWSLAYALGSFVCDGVSMTTRAHMLGISKATLSKNAVELCVGNDWPPSEYMRDTDTMAAFRAARLKSIQAENERQK